ncbi:hypothetical protein, partial [Carboxydocella sp. JDF658]|uniref:hypothetical protein n=1 Tax=Carboxydocella sp. JDF658 TaxID=1926600 RepID=UPI001A9A6566
ADHELGVTLFKRSSLKEDEYLPRKQSHDYIVPGTAAKRKSNFQFLKNKFGTKNERLILPFRLNL